MAMKMIHLYTVAQSVAVGKHTRRDKNRSPKFAHAYESRQGGGHLLTLFISSYFDRSPPNKPLLWTGFTTDLL